MVWVKVFVRQTWEPVLNLFPHNHFKGYLRGAVGSGCVVKAKLLGCQWTNWPVCWACLLSRLLRAPFLTLAIVTGVSGMQC